MVDMENQSSCRGDPGPFSFFCKCEDARNNTYACLRTLKGEEDTVRCFFEEWHLVVGTPAVRILRPPFTG